MPTDYGVLIKDGVNYSRDTAESISYDNSNNKLTSTESQGAIDELANRSVLPTGGTNQNYLRGDGTWDVPINTTYSNMLSDRVGYVFGSYNSGFLCGDCGGHWANPDTTYGLASTSSAGLAVQSPGGTTKYLKADGTWDTPSNTTYPVMSSGTSGLAPQATANNLYLRGDGTWDTPIDHTYAILTTGVAGLVSKLTNDTSKYLAGDGTWRLPTDHTYATVTTANHGLVPSGGTNTKYLRADGSWQIPTDHTYPTLTDTLNGLIPAGGTSATYLSGTTQSAPKWAAAPTPSNNQVKQEVVSSSHTGNHYILMAKTADDTSRKDEALKGSMYYSPVDGDLYMVGGNVRYRNDQLYLDNGVLVVNNTAAQQLYLAGSNETNYRVFVGVRQDAWTFCPHTTNVMRLGTSSYRWSTIYAISGTINTSDRNEKKNIVELSDFVKDFIMDLKPVSYKFKNNQEGINHDRTHYGLIAQDVEETMTKFGLTALDFAGFCRDQKMEEYVDESADPVYNPDGTTVNDIDGNPVKPKKQRPVEGEYIYGLRYEEFLAPMIKTLQIQEEGIQSRTAKINELKARLDLLENK